jgi:hypothetical protein
MLTQERVQHLFTYDKENGLLIRNFKTGRALAGTSSFAKDKDGYHIVGIDNKLYRTHRVIWLYVYGEFPSGFLDHINRNRTDNRIENLREVSKAQSRENIGVARSNKCGLKGIWLHKQTKKWCASICSNGKKIHLGSFDLIEDAYAAYQKAAFLYHTLNPMSVGENP